MRGKKKARSISGAGRGSLRTLLAYPVAPMERTRLRRTVTGSGGATFMNVLLCTPLNQSSGCDPT